MNLYDLDKSLDRVKAQMRKNPPPIPEIVRQRLDQTYAALESNPMIREERPRFRRFSPVLIAASIILVTCTALIGGALVSPVMADSLKQLPLIGSVFKIAGDIGLQTAEDRGLVQPGSNDSHDGITLSMPQVFYDGMRLVIAVRGEGGTFSLNLNDMIDHFTLFADGKEIALSATSLSSFSSPDHQSMIISSIKFSNNTGMALPDSFDLSVRLDVSGISEPFTLRSSVHKAAIQHTVIKPEISKKNDYIRFSVNTVDFSPVTTIISTTIAQLGSPSNANPEYHYPNGLEMNGLGYTVTDDKGYELKGINGLYGSGTSGTSSRPTTMQNLLTPFMELPKSITIKPYLSPTHTNGDAITDASGEWIKIYLPELEMTIPVKP